MHSALAQRWPGYAGHDRRGTQLVFNTCNTPPERDRQLFGDRLESIWKHCVFGLCGVPDVVRRMVGPVAGSSLEEREGWLGEVTELVKEAAKRVG